MSKHTKGPWEVRADWIVGFNGTLHIATIPRAFDGDYSEANALLIAAAPDLLAAHEMNLVELDFLLQAILAGDPKEQLVIRVTDIIKRTKSSVQKAEGTK